MFIRRDYLYTKCTFDEYYGQFITPEVLDYVYSKLKSGIITSEGENCQHIGLRDLSNLVYNLRPLVSDQLLIEAQEGWSVMTGVCIIKMAMKLIWRTHNEI
jgi:hypothetical protein